MADIVERLNAASSQDNPFETIALLKRAAIEIATLRQQLEEARANALEEAAAFAEADFRSDLAKKNNHVPEWLKHGRRIAKAIRALSAPQGREG